MYRENLSKSKYLSYIRYVTSQMQNLANRWLVKCKRTLKQWIGGKVDDSYFIEPCHEATFGTSFYSIYLCMSYLTMS